MLVFKKDICIENTFWQSSWQFVLPNCVIINKYQR